MADAALQIQTRIIGDPRLVSAARMLDVPPAFLLGPLLHLLCKALEYAEDGDLWRGDEESSIRFIATSAAWPGDAAPFVSALRREGWLDGWMISEWLGYAGEYLYRKYKTGNRDRLVEIHAKNGREYGKKRNLKSRISTTRNLVHPLPTTSNAPKKEAVPIAMNPEAEESAKAKSPAVITEMAEEAVPETEEGVADEKAVESGGRKRSRRIIRAGDDAFCELCPEDLLKQGIALSLDQLDCSGLTHLEVFAAFKPVFVFHSIATLNSFYGRCARCKCTPAWWTMVYMDKVHAVYRVRPDGQAWLEDDADPVALTMAALLPSYGRRHAPTEAARQLFLEIMIDHQRQRDGQASRWAGCVSGNFITRELDSRKGKAGKIT